MKYLISIIIVISTLHISNAQVLKSYIDQGLEHNLQLLQKENNYKQSQNRVRQAKAYYYPQISLEARYSKAKGGRIIDFPLGDLLNPVYENINNLYKLHGFPVGNPVVLENEQFPFYRPTEQETKLRLVQPLFNTDIHFNHKIQKELNEASYAELEAYKKELTGAIKSAYIAYQQALAYKEILLSSKEIAMQNLRLNQSLVKNQKATIDKVYRAESTLQKVKQQITEADKMIASGKAYFNYLVGRDLTDSISAGAQLYFIDPLPTLDALKTMALSHREELAMIDNYSDASLLGTKAAKWKKSPELNMVVDYGYQGEKYTFGKDDDFIMASMLLSWNIFSGFKEHAKVEEAILKTDELRLKRLDTEQQIMLQVTQAYYDVQQAHAASISSSGELEAMEKTFKIIAKQYQQGMCSYLEYLDAQSNYFSAKTKKLIAEYTLWIKYIELEKACGSELIFE